MIRNLSVKSVYLLRLVFASRFHETLDFTREIQCFLRVQRFINLWTMSKKSMQNPSAKICLKNHGKRCQIEPKMVSTLIKIRPKSIQKASVQTDLGEQSSRKRPGANYSCFTGVLKPPSLNYSCFIGVLRRPSSIYSIFIVFKASPKALPGFPFNLARRPPGGYRGVLKLQFFIIFIQYTDTNITAVGPHALGCQKARCGYSSLI